MTLIGYVFVKLTAAKGKLTSMPKEFRFRTSLDSQHVKEVV